ncbi:MAG: 6-carboxytetrahydropterin synthase [Planctomycetota bacterium]|jgi:6-pyruvoyltetrahydropterin/6-carboxytetrahydropterin synthase
MTTLTRRVRLCIAANDERDPTHAVNGHAGTPPPDGLGAHLELDVTCEGTPHSDSGYIINISEIDTHVRRIAPRILRESLALGTHADVPGALARITKNLSDALPAHVRSVSLSLSPRTTIQLVSRDSSPMNIRKTQSFSFSASHRLHNPELSNEENLDIYGKCNNPNGHGHNYVLDVTVRTTLAGPPCTFATLEAIVHEIVIKRFDHKHLNLDVDDFAQIPASVENIASRCAQLLREAIADGCPGSTLDRVRVWETEKTCATVELSD